MINNEPLFLCDTIGTSPDAVNVFKNSLRHDIQIYTPSMGKSYPRIAQLIRIISAETYEGIIISYC